MHGSTRCPHCSAPLALLLLLLSLLLAPGAANRAEAKGAEPVAFTRRSAKSVTQARSSLRVDHQPASPVTPTPYRPGQNRPYIPPVEAPVTDPFRAPANPYGPGNRGIEYATASGTSVLAAAGGVVTFAGAVAGSLYVTIQHPDAIRTSYSFLSVILVRPGQVVAQGSPVGLSGTLLHIGARIGDLYIDPAGLWGGLPHVMLIPLDGSGPPATAATRNRSALRFAI